MTEGQVRDRLLGAWLLLSNQLIGEDGALGYPLGDDAVGQLVYDSGGRVSAQLMRAGQPRFGSDDLGEAGAEEMCAAWPGYFGYFGTFTVDTGAETITHHVEGSSFPNLVGTDQVRRYRFDDGRLVLDADTPGGHVRITWKKALPTKAGRCRNRPCRIKGRRTIRRARLRPGFDVTYPGERWPPGDDHRIA